MDSPPIVFLSIKVMRSLEVDTVVVIVEARVGDGIPSCAVPMDDNAVGIVEKGEFRKESIIDGIGQ